MKITLNYELGLQLVEWDLYMICYSSQFTIPIR